MLLGRLGLAPVPPPPPSQPRTPDMDTKWRSDLKEKANK